MYINSNLLYWRLKIRECVNTAIVEQHRTTIVVACEKQTKIRMPKRAHLLLRDWILSAVSTLSNTKQGTVQVIEVDFVLFINL
jgi:hypothetical protein